MIDISLNMINKFYGATQVIQDLSLVVKNKDRVGIVGKNGCGKTTIFKIISGLEEFEAGDLSIRKGLTVGYLDQIPEYQDGYRVIDVLNEAFGDLNDIKIELKQLEEQMANSNTSNLDAVMKRYDKLQNEFITYGGYDIEEKLSKISTGLNINENFMSLEFNMLSGGEKTRVILGKILLQSPDILLLDEPSNHLDIASVEWLEEYLSDYNGTAVIISHDRYFLDKVVTKIIEIESMGAKEYMGNYSYYVEEKERIFLEQLKAYEQQEKKIKSMEEAIKRFRDWGTRADNKAMFIKAGNMEKRIAKMDKIDKPTEDNSNLKLSFKDSKRSGKEVIAIEGLNKSYDTKCIFRDAEFFIQYQDRIGLLGNNGCGKSTLLNMIIGDLMPDSGTIKLGSSLNIGYLDQNVEFEDENLTILDTVKFEHMLGEFDARSILARYQFYSDDVNKIVKNLSGGERSRLKLCIMLQNKINFLILDEPTNHLDIQSREFLEDALKDFNGTILFVSHDRYFINKIGKSISEIDNYKIKSYGGNYDYYKSEKQKHFIESVSIEPEPLPKVSGSSKKEKGNKPKGNPYKKKELETNIDLIEKEIALLEEDIVRYSDDYERLTEVMSKKSELDTNLNELLEQWCEY